MFRRLYNAVCATVAHVQSTKDAYCRRKATTKLSIKSFVVHQNLQVAIGVGNPRCCDESSRPKLKFSRFPPIYRRRWNVYERQRTSNLVFTGYNPSTQALRPASGKPTWAKAIPSARILAYLFTWVQVWYPNTNYRGYEINLFPPNGKVISCEKQSSRSDWEQQTNVFKSQ